MSTPMIIIYCEDCGKLAPIDTERSTDTWVVYKTDIPCTCGGKYVMELKKSGEVEE